VDMEAAGVMMPLAETQCKYYVGAKYAEDLLIETTLEELTPVKVALRYDVIRELDGKLLARGRTVQAFVGKETFRIINLQKKYPDIWEKLTSLK